MVKKKGKGKLVSKEDRREKAARLSKTCRGPPKTVESVQQEVDKKLSKLGTALHFEKRVAPVDSRAVDPDVVTSVPFKRQKVDIADIANPKAPSQVDALTLFNHVEKLKKTGAKVNWSAVATSFKLNSGKAALAVYDRYASVVDSMKPENRDPAPHIYALDLKRKNKLLLHAKEGEGGRVRQLKEEQWDEYIDLLRLEQYKENENAPNANLDTIGKLCEQTYTKLKDWAVPHRKSTSKSLTDGRVEAQNEPRNAIAFAAVVQAEMHDRPIVKELICSADMFTFWHDPSNGKTQWVRMTETAAAQLRDQKLGPGYAADKSGKSDKPVLGKGGIPVYGCIDAAGDIVCIVEIFADAAVPFVQPSATALYHVYPLQQLASFENAAYNSFVFAAVVNSEFDEEAMLQQIWETIIIPKQTKKAHDLLRARIAKSLPTVGLPTPSQSLSVSNRPQNAANPANSSDRSICGAVRVRQPPSPSSISLQSRRVTGHAAEMAAQHAEHVTFDVPLTPRPSAAARAAESLVAAAGSPANRTRSKKRPFRQMCDDNDLEAAFQVVFLLLVVSQVTYAQAALCDPQQHPDLKNLLYNTDGDIPQLNAAINDEKMQKIGRKSITGIMKKKTGKSKYLRHRLMKISGGCSPFESPNDASTVHRSSKKLTNHSSVVQKQRFDDKDQNEMMRKFVQDVFVTGIGKDIASSRKTLMTQYVKNSIRVFDVAFSKHNIQEGWRAVGAFYPHDPARIMSKWPGWVKLDPSDGNDILKAIVEDFAPIIPQDCRVDDSIMTARLPFLPAPQLQNVALRGVHQDRAIVLGETYDASRALVAPERVMRQESKKAKEAQQASLPISTVIVLFEQRGFGRFLLADVQAQLKLRKVPFKQSEKLGNLMEKWKKFDYDASLVAQALLAAASGVPAAAATVAIAAPAAAPTAVSAVAPAVAARAKTTCSACGQEGHNKKTCHLKRVTPAAAPAVVVAAASPPAAAPPPPGVGGGEGLGYDGSPAKRAREFAAAAAAARRDRAAQAQVSKQ